jgi:hypothetical protein
MNEEAIRAWVEEELKTNQDVIEDLTGDQIHELMVDNSFVMVYLCKCDSILVMTYMTTSGAPVVIFTRV